MYLCVLSSIPDDPHDKPYDPSPHMNGFKWTHHPMHPKGVEKQIRELINEGVDVFVNLVDGTPDDPLSGIGLVQIMEKLGAAFTGADSTFFDPSRQEMKAYAKKANVPAPNWVMVDRVEDVERVSKRLRFPVLVKPPHGYASVGITRESRCENVDQLKVQVGREIEHRAVPAALLERRRDCHRAFAPRRRCPYRASFASQAPTAPGTTVIASKRVSARRSMFCAVTYSMACQRVTRLLRRYCPSRCPPHFDFPNG